MRVIDNIRPFIKAQLGGDNGTFAFMTRFYEIEEQAGLLPLKRGIPELIDEHAVYTGKLFNHSG